MDDHKIRSKLNARLLREGRFEEYNQARQARIEAGTPPAEAWKLTMADFRPIDGSPLETELPPEDAPAAEAKPEPPAKKPAYPTNSRGAAHTPKFDARWQAITKQVPAAKVASPREVSMWIFENAGVDIGDVDVSTIPSRGAVRLLHWVQTHPAGYHEFLSMFYSKMMPNNAQMKGEGRFFDDGRKVLTLFAQLEQELEEPTNGG